MSPAFGYLSAAYTAGYEEQFDELEIKALSAAYSAGHRIAAISYASKYLSAAYSAVA